ncbi:SsrA-binding protein SmpB [Patescibacteria group bacterium]
MGKILAKNKRAYFDYTILDKTEAGLVLAGHEVKSIREGNVNLKGAYVTLKDQPGNRLPEAYLINAHISLYSKASLEDYDPTRSRKILLKKSEISQLLGKRQEKGLTMVPLTMYSKRGKIKLTVGLGRVKKKQDKRQDIKKREDKRSIERALRNK